MQQDGRGKCIQLWGYGMIVTHELSTGVLFVKFHLDFVWNSVFMIIDLPFYLMQVIYIWKSRKWTELCRSHQINEKNKKFLKSDTSAIVSSCALLDTQS